MVLKLVSIAIDDIISDHPTDLSLDNTSKKNHGSIIFSFAANFDWREHLFLGLAHECDLTKQNLLEQKY